MTTPPPRKPRIYDPGPLPPDLLQKQEVIANGVYCGHFLQSMAEAPFGDRKVHYPLDHFDADEDPILTADTECSRKSQAENLPILAWTITADGKDVYVAVDMLERRVGITVIGVAVENIPIPLTNCKVIVGAPQEVLPKELLERMGLI